MKVLVYMKDGRTVYLLRKRGLLAQLVGGTHIFPLEPWHEGQSVLAVRGIWNPHRGEYHWARVPLRHLARGSIAVVEEAHEGIADAVAMLPADTSETHERPGVVVP